MSRTKAPLFLSLGLLITLLLGVALVSHNGAVEAGFFLTPTLTSTPTPAGDTATPSPTLCPMGTPEPLWVEPVVSPTNLSTQTIYVFAGSNADKVEVISESGTFEDTTSPFEIEIALLPNTTHHLTVKATIREVNNGGCIYGGYTLTTTLDKFYDPLIILQSDGTLTATPTPNTNITPTSTPRPISLIAPDDQSHTTDPRPHFYWTTPPIAQAVVVLYIENLDNSPVASWSCRGCGDMVAQSDLPVGTYLWYVDGALGRSNETFTLFIDPTAATSTPGGETSTPTPAGDTTTPSPTLCPQGTPEPLWVEPVVSPTDLSTQIIYVYAGSNANKVEVISESGTFEDTTSPFEIEIALLPNTTHHLTVKAYIREVNNGGCISGGYTLTTTLDKFYDPLTIVQSGGTPTTPTPTNTACIMTATPPRLLSPVHRAHTTDTTPTFTWSSVTGAQSYRLYVAQDDRSFVFKKRLFSPHFTPANALSQGKYFWRVRAQDQVCGTWTAWSNRNTLFIE